MHSSTLNALWHSRWLQRWAIPILIFLLAFAPRAGYPVSRSDLWYLRSIRFADAVLARDWINTFQRTHPGVTTMWLAGVGIKVFAFGRGVSSAQLMGDAPAQPGIVAGAYTAGMLPLAAAIAAGIALCYPLVSRLASRKTALVACGLLALDPFHIMHSKVLHLDGFLAVVMLLSALFLLNYVRDRRWRDLVLAGVCTGLAFLTKSPSLFLIPYAGLVIGVAVLRGWYPNAAMSTWWSARARGVWPGARSLLIWGVVAVAVFFALWPAMWVDPIGSVSQIAGKTTHHVQFVHPQPLYFNDTVGFDDPGIVYYVATIGFRTTLVTLPMACASVVLALLRRNDGEDDIFYWLLVAYVFFFTLQMGIAAKKAMRYLLPVFPAWDVLAAFGVVWVLERAKRITRWSCWRWLSPACMALVLALQAGVSLPRHPYYGTHFNALLGGPRVAQQVFAIQGQCEGVDLAARYLNEMPHAQRARVAVSKDCAPSVERVFVGLTSVDMDRWTDYRVYVHNRVMRDIYYEDWAEAWEADQQTEPLWTVSFDGITYVWVYGEPPGEPAVGGPEYEVNVRLGEHIELTKVRISSEVAAPGDTFVVAPLWVSDGKVKQDYQVFCHLMSAEGELVAQRDGPPIYGVRRTPSWRADEIIEDSYDLTLPVDLLPGEYEVSVGMYDLETLQRVPAYAASGERLPNDRIVVATLQVEETGTAGQ